MTAMTLDRLQTILDAYGGNPERWPAAEREAALALLASSAEARRMVNAAAPLDRALAGLANPAADAIDPLRLVRAITAAPQRAAGAVGAAPAVPDAAARYVIRWPNIAGLAAAAIAGFLIGWTGIDQRLLPTPTTPGADQAEITIDPSEDWTW